MWEVLFISGTKKSKLSHPPYLWDSCLGYPLVVKTGSNGSFEESLKAECEEWIIWRRIEGLLASKLILVRRVWGGYPAHGLISAGIVPRKGGRPVLQGILGPGAARLRACHTCLGE